MSILTPQEMVSAIDTIGNTIATLCSDAVSLRNINEIFQETAAGETFKTIEENCPTPEFKAKFIKGLLVGDFLRQIQFAIYADDIIEDSELDAAYPLLKPLAYIIPL